MNTTRDAQQLKSAAHDAVPVDLFGERRLAPQAVSERLASEGLQYVETFVDSAEEIALLDLVDAGVWRSNLKRRVQHFGWFYDYKKSTIDPSMYIGPLPDWLQSLASRFALEGYSPTIPDQVIVNEYLPGQGISSHIDCLECFGPVVVSLSLGSSCVMNLASKIEQTKVSIPLARCSLLVLAGSARTMWSHAIAGRKSDKWGDQISRRGRRVSLTFRTVLSLR
jgi:alkylated DNA repair dioxygenase AlkB